ncbi:hypothetical protein AGMMS50249_1860 [candidate division SR1 bacterium]|nr:hypothetical protein AGMMS50249_1860 [candidate division SR1 bacterium]
MTPQFEILKKVVQTISDSSDDKKEKEKEKTDSQNNKTPKNNEPSQNPELSIKSSLEKQISTIKSLKEKDKETLFAYFNKLLSLQSLETKDIKKLEELKGDIEKQEFKDEQIEVVSKVLENLEKKADLLETEDIEIIKELEKIISETQVSASKLKDEVEDKKTQAKKEMIGKVRKKLDAHRYSSRLSDSVCEFLTDKFINKKKMGMFAKIIGGLGLGVAGIFLGNKLKDLIKGLENGTLEDITDKVDDIKDKIQGKFTPEQLKELHPKAKTQMKARIEQKFDRKMDENKFSTVFDTWREERKNQLSPIERVKDIDQRIKSGETIDSFGEAGMTFVSPPIAIVDLTRRMTEANLASRSEIAQDIIILPSGKAIVQCGLTSLGLFGNGIRTVLGSCTLEEYTGYIQKNISKMNVSSKEAMRGMLYRQGGPFWTLAGHIGTSIGEAISLGFMGKNGGDIGKVSAYRKGGVMGNFKKELEIFKQLEKSLEGTGVFNEVTSKSHSSLLEEMLFTAEKNNKIFNIAQEASSIEELENLLKKNDLNDVLKQLKDSPARDKKDLKVIKTKAGNTITKNMQGVTDVIRDTFNTRTKKLKGAINLPRMKIGSEKEITRIMDDYAQMQGKLLEKTQMFLPLKKVFARFEKGKQMAKMVDYSDGVKLYIKDVTDAKDFFDNLNTIGRESPTMLKTLFKGFPLFMMGGEMLDKLLDPENTDPAYKHILEGFGYLTPIVGPILLMREGMMYSEADGFQSLSSAGIGLGMLGIDGFRGYKVAQLKGKKGILKYIVSPITDAGSILKSVGTGAGTAFKIGKDGFKVLKTGEFATFATEFGKFGLKAGAKLSVIAGLAYLGYTQYESFLDDEKDKAERAKLQKKTPAELEKYVQSERPKLKDDEKATFIKLATAARMNITNLDLLDAKKDKNQISISLKTLVNKDELASTQSDIQQAINKLDNSDNTKLSFTFNGGTLKEDLLARKQTYKLDNTGLTEYIIALGYSATEAEKMIKSIA